MWTTPAVKFIFLVCRVAGPRLIHTFPADGNNYEVDGLALLNNELYVLCRENEKHVVVHSTADFTLLRHITVEGADYLQDIAACAQKQCIYIPVQC